MANIKEAVELLGIIGKHDKGGRIVIYGSDPQNKRLKEVLSHLGDHGDITVNFYSGLDDLEKRKDGLSRVQYMSMHGTLVIQVMPEDNLERLSFDAKMRLKDAGGHNSITIDEE